MIAATAGMAQCNYTETVGPRGGGGRVDMVTQLWRPVQCRSEVMDVNTGCY